MKKPKIKIETRTETTITRELELGDAALIAILNAYGYAVPKNASITFTTPGGGDWSNTAIDVTAKHPITITWLEHK